MRKVLFCLLMVGLAGGLYAQGVAGTDHDLSINDTGGRICVFCHFPHNANPAVPLWNHTLSTATMTAYDSPTMDAPVANWAANNGSVSGLCMACHDGTVGLGSVVNQGSFGVITDPGAMGAVPARLGTDLSNDHPVVFSYQASIAGGDTELTAYPAGGDFGNGIQLYGAGANQVECASCHDVHNTPGIAPFLVVTDTGSALCLTCHIK